MAWKNMRRRKRDSKDRISFFLPQFKFMEITMEYAFKWNGFVIEQPIVFTVYKCKNDLREQLKLCGFDINFNKKHEKYTDFIAEIIQHEIDHTNGIII